ncbi:AraC family transcriptional regulator [Joostella sp. CR20]|uniref:AraC family transcriptional regulator n=1 Tax=Joostella sp. CR20 TaxID=2804312 RepID=UPI00313D970C
MNGFHDGFSIVQGEVFENETKQQKHNYFQIVYIKEGEGTYLINDIHVPYQSESIFLLAPQDYHQLQPVVPTKYSAFNFTEIIFSNKSNLPDRKVWLENIEHILHHPNMMPGDCIINEEDRERLWRIHDFIIVEFKNQDEFFWSIITNGITTSLSIIARNIIKKYAPNKDASASVNMKKSDQILAYIRTHVYEPELIKIESLAEKFNMSQANIVHLFKKETGESIRQYIINYKLMLVKYRLKNTNYSISEIGYELGFTDESHLTKTFKSRFKKTPKQYRLEVIN